MERLRISAAILLLGAVFAAPRVGHAASAIETAYRAVGPWAVTSATISTPGGAYTLFYPTNLGAGGVDHPVLTWGNGTGATPSKYTGILGHLASWGFVVIASNSGSVGLGTQLLDAVDYLIVENAYPASPFYQKLDLTKIGALGHSQGAGGALNATLDSEGLVTSTVTIALPDPIWWSTPVPNMSTYPTGARIFFIRGTTDFLATQTAAQNWYNPVPGGAARAALKNTGHNEIQKSTTRLKGYVTAWLLYTLSGDAYARGAFAGAAPELNGNTGWQNAAEKNLP